MAVAMVVLNKMLPQSENGVFNAESGFMLSPDSESGNQQSGGLLLTSHYCGSLQHGDQLIGRLEAPRP